MITQIYSIPITPNSTNVRVNIHQGDADGRILSFNLIEKGGSVFSIPQGATAFIEAKKPSGAAFSYEMTIEGDVLSIPVSVQMAVEKGIFPGQIRVEYDGGRLLANNFEFWCQKDVLDDATMSDTEIPGLIESIEINALRSEGYALGTQHGEPVSSGTYYENNAKWYAEQASASASDADDSADRAETAAGDLESAVTQVATNTTDIASLKTRVDAIEEAEGLHKYGVSGIGNSAVTLTRLWDSIGMTAQVGTDGDNSNVINDFDHVTPFNRRKCVGTWELVNGRAEFRVHAYMGDADYVEDGTNGDYVAVECPRAYYYLSNGVLGVSAHQYEGWRPFDIFCRNHDPLDTVPYYYAPAYALAIKDGKAVSLPGLDNAQGNYKELLDKARTYAESARTKAILMPMAYNFYEWALFTVEFATQNCQAIMQGCAGLRHNADDRATLRSDGKWLLNNYQAARVVGEYVSIQDVTIDINHSSYYASHKITAITRCDASGNASASGAYQLVETEDLGVGRTYVVGTAYRIAARPYRTGSCNGVSTPSGSPVSNANGYYPCKYRWHENPYSNQYKTMMDLFNKRVGTSDSDYYLEWYLLLDPSAYTPSSTSKPDATDLATSAFVKLDVETSHANYANGYIRSKAYSEEYPDIWIPELTSGSASTYFCDYAYLVYSYAVRAVRLGGYWPNGATDGFSYLYGISAPSLGAAYSGGDLYFTL